MEEVTIGSDKDLRYGTMDEYNQEIGGEVKTTLFRSERSSFLKKMKKSKLFKVLRFVLTELAQDNDINLSVFDLIKRFCKNKAK